jgi:hypothetical protein
MKLHAMARRMSLHLDSTGGKTAIRLALGLLLLCIIFPKNTFAQATRSEEKFVPTRDSTILKSRENELRAAGEKLLRAFRAGDTKTFLALVHPKYFSEGAESKNYTLAELKESFRAREGMYCYLFDASCIPPQPPPGRNVV